MPWAKIIPHASILLVIAILLIGIYKAGENAADNRHKAKSIQELSEQLDERGVTNEEVRNATLARKCELLGGVFRDGICE
jgi:hypothetical protein